MKMFLITYKTITGAYLEIIYMNSFPGEAVHALLTSPMSATIHQIIKVERITA